MGVTMTTLSTRRSRGFVAVAAVAIVGAAAILTWQQVSHAGDSGPQSEKEILTAQLSNPPTSGETIDKSKDPNPTPSASDDSKHLSDKWENSIGSAQPPLPGAMFSDVNSWNGWSKDRMVTVYAGSAGVDRPDDGAVVMVIWADSGAIVDMTPIQSVSKTGALKVVQGENDGVITLEDSNGQTHTYDPASNRLD